MQESIGYREVESGSNNIDRLIKMLEEERNEFNDITREINMHGSAAFGKYGDWLNSFLKAEIDMPLRNLEGYLTQLNKAIKTSVATTEEAQMSSERNFEKNVM